jgi:chromosome partitioning protein
MITVIGGIKGGVGKTTIATNLAVCHALTGKKVLLVDADDQRSSSDWAAQREEYSSDKSKDAPVTTISITGSSIHKQLLKMKSDYDHIIVDTGGRETMSQRSALTAARKFIIPFKPRSLDIWTIGLVKKLVEEIKTVNPKMQCYFVINQADARGNDNDDALRILQDETKIGKIVPSMIINRKAFSNAAADGLGVLELPLKKDVSKCCEEILALVKMIYF